MGRETIRRQFQDSDAHSHVRSPRHAGSPKRHVDLSGLDLDGCSPPLPDRRASTLLNRLNEQQQHLYASSSSMVNRLYARSSWMSWPPQDILGPKPQAMSKTSPQMQGTREPACLGTPPLCLENPLADSHILFLLIR